jgi:hypothetical protein
MLCSRHITVNNITKANNNNNNNNNNGILVCAEFRVI